jgi:poly-gamma-glutamate capsule biosynthesis protein CapA/YwtB (metallophosphatase superfamily)
MRGRRQFLRQLARIALGVAGGAVVDGAHAVPAVPRRSREFEAMPVTLFLCGDVMLGRGIDQILEHPSDPVLHEEVVRDARRYLELAEAANGRIPRNVAATYVWGEALTQWQRRRPDARIINLESSITRHDHPWPKGINYRMHPRNIGVLTAARIDCCVLANNHVLDWEREGLAETLATLRTARISVTGAGSRLSTARAPAVLPLANRGRVLVFAAATGDAGVPESWAASGERSGVHRLPDLSGDTVARIAADVRHHRRTGDIVVFSVHWGGNWGYAIASAQRAFAHALIDEAGVDLVHGHSSHHPKAIEVHREHLILYGCGDFLNDYEGIGGHEGFRGELGLMYFPTLDSATGRLRELELVPTRIRRFRVREVQDDDRQWLLEMLHRECGRMGCGVGKTTGGAFALRW